MAWLQLKASIPPEQAEWLEELLLAEGASAITLQDAHDEPVFEPDRGTTPLWRETVLTGLYDDLAGVEAMIERVQRAWAEQSPDEPAPQIEYELLADRDWEREWMDGFEPLRMGERLWIVPSWHEAPDPDAVNLLLDPGLAFGTGTHPTTALCLGWLDAQDLAQRQILDYGCGSGILAIAALKLGAEIAVGVDIDPQALQASRDNAERNQIDESSLVLDYPERIGQGQFEVVVANILAGPLIEMAATIAARVRPDGLLALSGILEAQTESVLEAYRAQGLIMDEPKEKEGWMLLTGRRPGQQR
ncbi:ribosomal protein L11 methyltransferase [Salinicola sp. MH3R3-1]|uniref:50S ribosomal protein L11 methyltransferase n=1 Tax=Salinicola TaxID=404432 RepID=UPI00094E9D9E|nr:50S ribosomal protein L11 methyltransferase [Salinicola sp. MH3R3-1]OLO08112.1 ribosomal protein L11 methyltransferase [Salinicola sp. MH3R3-1]